jgi:hypothetical protein
MYYVTNGKVYKTDVATTTETYQFDVPAGETVTAMQQIRWPETAPSVNYIAIATYNGSRYKIWLHTQNGTNDITGLSQPNYEGEGRVSRMIYMENGIGSRVY